MSAISINVQASGAEPSSEILFDLMMAAKARANASGTRDDMERFAQSYSACLRSMMPDLDREVLRLSDIIVRQNVELADLRRQLSKVRR